MDYLISHGLLSEHQHGFLPGRSCSMQLLTVMNKWTEALDNGQTFDVVYLDFAKAFDSVPHKRLLHKLASYGVNGKLLAWIHAFLSNRRQRVVVNGEMASWSAVTSGVPQGSVLGPLLFLVFINDLPEAITSPLKIFADDTKIYRVLSTVDDNQELQDDIDSLSVWSEQWQMPFNTKKCKVMHFGHGNAMHQYAMNGENLEATDHEKDLGVVVDDKLRFHLHSPSCCQGIPGTWYDKAVL